MEFPWNGEFERIEHFDASGELMGVTYAPRELPSLPDNSRQASNSGIIWLAVGVGALFGATATALTVSLLLS